MKALLIIFILVIGGHTVAHAQISITAKAGATVSKVAFSDDIQNAWDADFWPKVGFAGGVAFEVPLTEAVAVQPEILWVQKGFYYEYEEPLYSESYNVTLNYLEIPVLLKAKMGRIYLAAGPSVAYGISGRYKGSYTEEDVETDDKGKVKFGKRPDGYTGDDQYVDNAMDFGVQVGMGVRTNVLVIDFRYGFGLSNLYDEGEQFSGDVKSQNRCLQLTLGYVFTKKE